MPSDNRKTVDIKPSGCVNPYHPPECPWGGVSCIDTEEGFVVISKVRFVEMTTELNRLRSKDK